MSNSTSNSTSGPDFVKKLFKMLEDESYSDIVSWGVNGDSFVVKEIDAFTKTILPRHFKHSNFASFVRQLNKYDFHKIRNNDDGASPYGEQAWEFKHPKFQCNQRDQLDNIKRKTPTRRTNVAAPTVGESSTTVQLSDLQTQVNSLKKLQFNMNQHLYTLSKNYHTVVHDLLNFQKNFLAQDQLMRNLVQYVTNLEAAPEDPSPAQHGAESSAVVPSEEAQKLIGSYTDVARASLEQMNEISRRAQSLSQLAANKTTGGMSSAASESPATPPPEPHIGFVDSLTAAADTPATTDTGVEASPDLPTDSGFEQTLSSISVASELADMAAGSDGFAGDDLMMQHIPIQSVSSTGSSQDGLTVFTVGRLAPRQSQTPPTAITQVSPESSSNVPHIDSTSAQRQPNTMRVHRSTYVPAWSVPPKVLLVEDDAVYQNIGSKLLQVFGCSIDIAVDGISAVNKMNLGKYDLVLMDIVLPRLDGVGATTQIRRFDPTTPIISMTANTTERDCVTYLTHGMNDILAKPFTKNNLLTMLNRYCTHLKAMPTNQDIPRPLASSSVASPALSSMTLIPNASAIGDVSVNDWIQSSETLASTEDEHVTSNFVTSEEYFQILNRLNPSAAQQSTAGMIRYLDDVYDNDEDNVSRPKKKSKSSWGVTE